MGWQWVINVERGHPVRQRAKPAQVYAKASIRRLVRAARSGGQDVRAPLAPLLRGIEIDDLAIILHGINQKTDSSW